MDFGAVVDGYCSDITRTVVVGPASDEQRAVYDVVRDANERAAAGCRAGMTGRDADALARDYIERARIRRRCSDTASATASGWRCTKRRGWRGPRTARSPKGAVVTIEPGIYRPGWGGVRIEDDVVLGADGPQILTQFPARADRARLSDAHDAASRHTHGPMIDLRYVKKLIDILDESTVDSIEISSDKGMKIRISKSPTRPRRDAGGSASRDGADDGAADAAGAGASHAGRRHRRQWRRQPRRKPKSGGQRGQVADGRHVLLGARSRARSRTSRWVRASRRGRSSASSRR